MEHLKQLSLLSSSLCLVLILFSSCKKETIICGSDYSNPDLHWQVIDCNSETDSSIDLTGNTNYFEVGLQ